MRHDLCRLCTDRPSAISRRHKTWEKEELHLRHSQIPIRLDSSSQINQSQRHLPVIDRRWVWIEREDFEVNRIELVDLDGRLRVGVKVLVKLLQNSVYRCRAIRSR